ncbi:MAG: hypothetical protein CAPSK01_003331 [Candidatus Accumulibacter vicinus]|uniref:Uncharacterized protein n=1 Tax=Candidatus Accumulibacter vicinus TaxID=2954382 RepID=A0A084XXM0_9PROT|nr:MAG: hypothetical protein CAPSK01_003331 [Candidatus Accumulibacter vicinus]
MTENAILRKARAKRLLEGIDVIDPLADERTFAEHVLVDIRGYPRVRVDARLTAIQSRIARAVRSRQTDRHARLQNAIAGRDPLFHWVVIGTVERVRHGADELPRRVTRQLRIGVQGDHVLDVGQYSGVSDDEREPVPATRTQQRVQRSQLAALALVSHPDAVVPIPQPRAMEQEENVPATAVAVLLVELVDSAPGQFQQGSVGRQRFLLGVAEIGQ